MTQQIRRLWTDDSGQDLVEYALLVALIAIVVIGAVRLLGPIIADFYTERIVDELPL